jgi:hypothetical protein
MKLCPFGVLVRCSSVFEILAVAAAFVVAAIGGLRVSVRRVPLSMRRLGGVVSVIGVS